VGGESRTQTQQLHMTSIGQVRRPQPADLFNWKPKNWKPKDLFIETFL
jgi:hypothetical protein